MRKRTVPPRAMSAVGGLKMLPGVKTSSVSGYSGPGWIASVPLHAANARHPTMATRKRR